MLRVPQELRLEGGACGSVEVGPKGLEGRSLAELVEGGGALIERGGGA